MSLPLTTLAEIEPAPLIITDAASGGRAAGQRRRISPAASSWPAMAVVAIPAAVFVGYMIVTKPAAKPIASESARTEAPHVRADRPEEADPVSNVETKAIILSRDRQAMSAPIPCCGQRDAL